MSQPIKYKGDTVYPILHNGCEGCYFGPLNSTTCESVQDEYNVNCGLADREDEVIWQTGEKAKLKFLTQRLKSE